MVIHVNNAFQFLILIDYLLNYQAILILPLFTFKVSAESVARYYLWLKVLNPHRLLFISLIYIPITPSQNTVKMVWQRNWGDPSHLISLGLGLIGTLFYLSRGNFSSNPHPLHITSQQYIMKGFPHARDNQRIIF